MKKIAHELHELFKYDSNVVSIGVGWVSPTSDDNRISLYLKEHKKDYPTTFKELKITHHIIGEWVL